MHVLNLLSLNILFIYSVALSLLYLCGCAKTESESVSTVAVPKNTLVFVSTDLLFTSSELLVLDLDTQRIESLLPKQSGDFVIYADQGRLFAVNRKKQLLNIREIFIKDGEFHLGKQMSLPSDFSGDPHGLFVLDDEVVGLLGYNSHQIVVYDLKKAQSIQVIDSVTNVPGGFDFRPESFVRHEQSYFILHQGYSGDFTETASAAIYGFQWNESSMKLVPLSDSSLSFNELRSHLPAKFLPYRDGYLINGLCYSWLSSCKAAVDLFTPGDAGLNPVEITITDGVFAYGDQVGSGNLIYGQFGESSNDTVTLSSLDISAGVKDVIHTYDDVNDDGYADLGFLHLSGDTLYFSVPKTQRQSHFYTYKNSKKELLMTMPYFPNSSVLVKDYVFDF